MGYIKNTTHFLDYQKLDGSIITFNLSIQHTIIKKYNLIFNQVNTILDRDINFHILYDDFMTTIYDCVNDNKEVDFEKIRNMLPDIVNYIDKHAEELNYWEFSYAAPKKLSEFKLHIDKNGYLEIMKASVRSKFICVPVTVLRNKNISLVRYIYNYICKEMIESGVQFKLERIIDSIVLSTSARGMDTKSQLWIFFSTAKGLDPQNLALRERNAIFYKGLPTIATRLNPVNWFVSLSRTSIKFQMKDKINEINVAFNAPIESCYENSADMLKVFIYEEATSNRKLRKLLNEFPFAHEMSNGYVYPITNWISAPFISKVFNVGNLNITHLINILLLNIYAYKFLREKEPNWKLFDMLTYKAASKPVEEKTIFTKISECNQGNPFTSRIMFNLIRDKLEKLKFTDETIYTQEQLEDLFKFGIKTLLSYDYFDYKDNKMTIDPFELTNEYIEYIYNILTHKYDDVILKAREYIKC